MTSSYVPPGMTETGRHVSLLRFKFENDPDPSWHNLPCNDDDSMRAFEIAEYVAEHIRNIGPITHFSFEIGKVFEGNHPWLNVEQWEEVGPDGKAITKVRLKKDPDE